ncbi:histidine kinase dimerization/phosphoacceptor domain-containing protein [Brachybacterium sp. Z12]|nr:histidine kinase dimerization/phosphoacceptor domain-containing protein [Brachybacterium sp. Z12]QNN83208.1 histidine kinase dimerization/phosphoacceptor domain-containing protein [Brachybacterium sp. Z12]
MTIAYLAFVLVVVGWPVTTIVYEVHPAAAMSVSVAAGAAALMGARWPWAGLALSAVSALAMLLVTAPGHGTAPWPWPVTALLAHCLTLAVLAIFHRWFWALSAWSAGAILTLLVLLVTDPAVLPGGTLRTVTTNGVVLVAISGGVVLLGLTARQLILARGQAEQAQNLSADEMRRRRELEDRGRIARELHDVVAHSMSVITVQAGTAKFRLQHLDEATMSEFEDIAASSRQALGEMRSLLTILRTDDSLEEVPMPGLPRSRSWLRRAAARAPRSPPSSSTSRCFPPSASPPIGRCRRPSATLCGTPAARRSASASLGTAMSWTSASATTPRRPLRPRRTPCRARGSDWPERGSGSERSAAPSRAV